MTPTDYTALDGLALAALVQRGETTPEDLLAAALAQIDAHNPGLNAVIQDGRALAAAELAARRAAGSERQGAFAGVPVLVKDLVSSVRGLPTWHGNRLLRARMPPADHDSAFIARLRASGAVILGKTNTPEFGLTPFTEPEATGVTRNPWNPAHTTGGSSGGSAAAVAARMVPLATGGDGGGSIRIPSSCCGLFGLKPTRGRVPTGPDFGDLWSGFAIEHVLTRSVRDSAAMLDAVAGADVGAPNAAPGQDRPFLDEVGAAPGRLRIGVCTTPWLGHAVHPECERAVADAAALLRELGHEVVEFGLPIEREAFAEAFLTVLAANLRAEIEQIAQTLGQRRAHRRDHEAASWALGLIGRSLSGDAVMTAQNRLQASGRLIGQAFESIDALLTPTLAAPPPLIGALQPTPGERVLLDTLCVLNAPWLMKALGVFRLMADKIFDFIPYTPVFNVTGQPAMSVPLHWSAAGLPVGVQFVGRFGGEALLLRLAAQLEQARPWGLRRPPGV